MYRDTQTKPKISRIVFVENVVTPCHILSNDKRVSFTILRQYFSRL